MMRAISCTRLGAPCFPRKRACPRRVRASASDPLIDEVDVVVVGSGVGGLSCGAMLAKYGSNVAVLEAHSIPGGCAHGWTRGDFHFDSGTSVFFGISNRDLENPLTSVLALLDEEVEMIVYDDSKTKLFWNNDVFQTQIGSLSFASAIGRLWGHQAQQEWTALQLLCKEYGSLAASIHPLAVRYDNWIALTAIARAPLTFFKFMTDESALSTAEFSQVVHQVVRSPELVNFVNILCQGTSGLAYDEILSSYMIRAFNQLYQTDSKWEFPKGGSQSIVNALVRGLRKHNGTLHLNSRVRKILVENGRACGVELKNGKIIHARQAVVSNATIWDTVKMIPSLESISPDFMDYLHQVEKNDSFMHLHVAFDGNGLENLPLHAFFFDQELVNDSGWPTICIPTAVDSSVAPDGKHTLHAYLSEPYDAWKGLSLKSERYKNLKAEKAKILWKLIERVIPDIQERIDFQLSGSPLTHERFLNRSDGTYGPKNLLKVKTTPTAICPLSNVFCVGDSTFPGTGTPAAASSAMWVANTLSPIQKHWQALDQLAL